MFTINDVESGRIKAWKERHDLECPLSPQNNKDKLKSPTGAIGGRISYSFTPTGLGNVVEVDCVCKKGEYHFNATDFDGW